jgi:hypothetical protein
MPAAQASGRAAGAKGLIALNDRTHFPAGFFAGNTRPARVVP